MDEAPNLVWLGFLGSLLAGLGTSVGALGVFAIRRLSERTENALLSLAAGVMLAAAIFSSLLPGIEYAEAQLRSRVWAVTVVSAGLAIGAISLNLIHRYAPHEHFFSGREGPDAPQLSRIWLLVIAVTLHNFPEGVAVGVGFAGGDIANGLSLTIGIGLQNIAEGLAVAASLLVIDYPRIQAVAVASLTGMVEPIGGLIGSVAVSLSESMMPWAMGFAAGAMLFIINDEIIPETHRRGRKNLATFYLLAGFVLMTFLDVTLG